MKRIEISLIHNLVLLALAKGEKRVTEIMNYMHEITGLQFYGGSIFPSLYRLLNEGYIVRTDSTYKITKKGKEQLMKFKELIERIYDELSRIGL